VLASDSSVYERLAEMMRKRGIEYELDPKEPWFLCEAHSDEDVDCTLEAFRDSLKEVLSA
jgi:glutamate-1-semialdehyde aminotransferase